MSNDSYNQKDHTSQPNVQENNTLSKKTGRRFVTNAAIAQFEKQLYALSDKSSIHSALKNIKPALENAKEKGFSIQQIAIMAAEALNIKITPSDINKALGLIKQKKINEKTQPQKQHDNLSLKDAITAIGGQYNVQNIIKNNEKIPVSFISGLDWQNISKLVHDMNLDIINQTFIVQTQPKTDWSILIYNNDKLTSKTLPNTASQKKQHIAKDIIEKI
jgi:hypothetical protein